MARIGNSRSPVLQMRMTSWSNFYAFTTRFFDRNRWLADDGLCGRRAGIYPPERGTSVGCAATHGAHALLGLARWPGEPQLFLDGEPEVIAPEPPTWRAFLKSLDAKDYAVSDIKQRLEAIEFEPSQLDEEMDESWWEMHYDRISGPSAKAYRLLDKIDLGPDLGRRGDGPHLQFREGGGNQFDYSLHAHASDMLALSLLQAQLIDLQLPIKLEEWKYR